MDSWGRFYTRPFLPVKGEDAVPLHYSDYAFIFLIPNGAQTSQLLVKRVCKFVFKCRRKLSHLLHLLVLPHTSVSHEEVRVILLTERNFFHCSFIQLGDQLRCKQQPQYLKCSHSSVIIILHVRANVCVCVYTHGDASLCTV